MLLVAAAFTAFYMWRQIVLVFFDRARSEAAEQAPESNGAMLLPLLILAIFSIIIGFINVPKSTPIFDGIYQPYEFKYFLEHSLVSVSRRPLAGFQPVDCGHRAGIGHRVHSRRQPHLQRQWAGQGQSRSAGSGWRFSSAIPPGERPACIGDEIYSALIEKPFNRLAAFLADRVDWDFLHNYFHDSIIKRGFDTVAELLGRPFDLGIVDGAVNGVRRLCAARG